ncbi:MAG: S8 family serine peptidase [Nitrospirae bacterium]|nr:S8 family serine peptidase [Nitrospirota bacterium]
MRNTVFLLFLCLGLFLSSATGSDAQDIRDTIGELLAPEHIEGEIIVKFKHDIAVNSEALTNASALAHARTGASVRREFRELRGMQLVKIQGGKAMRQALESYLDDPQIEYAEPNYVVHALKTPDDPSFNQLWGLHNTGQTGGTQDSDIDAPEAWDFTTGSGNVVIAVIDTGVAYNHPDLSANIWSNAGETSCADGIDNDGNGYTDDCRGWDFIGNDNDPADFNGHGTHVSGTIAAVGNNNAGISGVMWTARIMPLRFLGVGGSGSTADAISAFLYANTNGAHVINNSWGGSGYSQALKDAIDASNAVVVCAAGNNGMNTDSNPLFTFYPSGYASSNIISVAATDDNDMLAYFSNYGAVSVDVAAPGVDIFSTVPQFTNGTPVTILSENFDGATGALPLSGWNRGGANSKWAVTAGTGVNGTGSLEDSPGGNYPDNTSSWAGYMTPVTSVKDNLYTLSFKWKGALENNVDYLDINYSTNGVTWDWADYRTGSTGGNFISYSTSALTSVAEESNSFYIGFGLSSGYTVGSNDGFYLDEVVLTRSQLTIGGYGYTSYQGTSMAAPHVSGLAGLIKAYNPALSNLDIKNAILNGVDTMSSLSGKVLTGGRINAYKALQTITDYDGDGYAANQGDCSDADPFINPGAAEVCDELDNNCDGHVDEGLLNNSYFPDGDSDGYGDPAVSVQACSMPQGYAADNTDCNDTDSLINPGAGEVCDNLDNNCNGQTDEGYPLNIYYLDSDGDAYGNPAAAAQYCAPPAGYAADNTDCNDDDPSVHPGAIEVCDSTDNNCSGQTDDCDSQLSGGIDFSTAPAGSIGYLSVNNSNLPGISNSEFTVEAWVKPRAANTNGGIFSRLDSTGTAMWVKNNEPRFGIIISTSPTSTATFMVGSGFSILKDVWYHVAGMLTNMAHSHPVSASCSPSVMAETPHIDLYINGAFAVCASTNSQFAQDPSDLSSLFIGRLQDPGIDGLDRSTRFDGAIDEVRFWTVARTEQEIQQCMNDRLGFLPQCPVDPSILKGYWRLDEGFGPVTADSSGNGYGGIIQTDPGGGLPSGPWDGGWAAGSSASDRDSDGYTSAQGDCNDSDPSIYPDAPETCDGKDNDCDALSDNGIPATPTTCGVGACASTGQNICQNGQMIDTCAAGQPATEICDGTDNDCNGQTDEEVGFFVTGGPMAAARSSFTATLLPDGKVLVAGGYAGDYLSSAEIYDPSTGTFSATGPMSSARAHHTATLLPDGKVLISGGTVFGDYGYIYRASAEIYDPSTGTFTATGSMGSARSYHTATLLPDGKVLIAGGVNTSDYLSSAEIYDPSTGTFSATGPMVKARFGHTATLLPNGKVFIAGGMTWYPNYISQAEIYDPSAGTFTETGRMLGRAEHSAILLSSGKVLVAGGDSRNDPSSAEIYDPSTGTFTATGSMSFAREDHTATLLPDGRVLFAGGYGNGNYLSSAELYDPSHGKFVPAGSMTVSRSNHTATLLTDGKVLIAGGAAGSYHASAETYQLVSCAPDLIIQSIATSPLEPVSGQNVDVTVTFRNRGSAPAGSFSIDFYKDLTTAPTLGQAGDFVCNKSGLPAGAADTCTWTLTYDPAGNYNMWAQADIENALAESDEMNNVYGPQTVIVLGKPDLSISDLTLPLTSGEGKIIALTDTTKNSGQSSAGPSVTKFYYSTNSILDASDTYIGERAAPSLASGASSTGSVDVTIPAGATTGVRYIIARADATGAVAEMSETNNKKTRSLLIGPDLTVSALAAPAQSGAGRTITVTDMVRNNGGGDAGASTTKLYLSTNSTYDAGDLYLGERDVPALAAKTTNTAAMSIVIPSATAPGTYYIVANADSNRAVPETSETNNSKNRVIRITP